MSFKKVLTEKQRKKLAAKNEAYAKQCAWAKQLTNANLVRSLKYSLSQMCAPSRFEPGEPIYDATVWYVLIPELLKRLR